MNKTVCTIGPLSLSDRMNYVESVHLAFESLGKLTRTANEENLRLRQQLTDIKTNALKNLEHPQLIAVFGEDSSQLIKSLGTDYVILETEKSTLSVAVKVRK